MKKLISKAGRAIALQAVIFASFFAISTVASAEMPPLPKQIWSAEQKADDAKVAEDARRDPNKYCTQCHESANATGKPFSHAGKHFHSRLIYLHVQQIKNPQKGDLKGNYLRNSL